MISVLALVAQRVLIGLGVLVAVSLLLFLGVEALPGNFAELILGQSATPESVASMTRELGLDRPAILRYVEWLAGAAQGDLGKSWASDRDVSEQIGKRLANTLFLAGVAAAIAVPLALFLGIIAVLHRDGWIDRAINFLSLGFVSLPEFFIGYVLIALVAVKLQIAPSMAMISPGMTLGESLHAIALPVATLTLAVLGHMMRMTRAAILNVMSQPYIETAQLKGLTAFQVIALHAAPNAVAPIVNVIALNLAYLVVGVVVVEVIFVYPGMGQYFVDAVTVRDMPVVQACGLVFAAVYILLNTLADVVAILANPRLMHPK